MMASRLTLFKKFENEEYVSKNDLAQITDYICGNLNNWMPNYQYWYNMYSYTSKAYIVFGGEKKEVINRSQNGGRQFVKII